MASRRAPPKGGVMRTPGACTHAAIPKATGKFRSPTCNNMLALTIEKWMVAWTIDSETPHPL